MLGDMSGSLPKDDTLAPLAAVTQERKTTMRVRLRLYSRLVSATEASIQTTGDWPVGTYPVLLNPLTGLASLKRAVAVRGWLLRGGGAVTPPLLHERTALLEKVAARIGPLYRAPHRMG